MTLKENGNNRRRKNFLKCDNCKERFEINESDIEKIEGYKYIICPCCGENIILK